MDWKSYLKSIYYNPSNPASLSGPEKLYRFVLKDGKYNISKYKIRKWLQSQETYSLQRPVRRPQNRTHINVAGIDDQWSADLMDMMKFSTFNDKNKYILVVIDVFSKYLWLRGLQDKKGETVAQAFKSIFQEGRKPQKIRTDMGQEFRARVVQNLFKKEHIRQFYAMNETKAAVSERVLKTIKSKIYRFFTFKQSYRYIDILQRFADGYNSTIHRTIDMEPKNVSSQNEEEVRLQTYFSNHSRKELDIKQNWRFKFKIGDHVRITHLRNIFTREYDEKWTGEIFTVARRFWRDTIPVYRLKDYVGDEIDGTFYQSELQKIMIDDSDTWKIEKILRTKGKGRNKQYYVKWLYFPKKFNSWVKASNIENL